MWSHPDFAASGAWSVCVCIRVPTRVRVWLCLRTLDRLEACICPNFMPILDGDVSEGVGREMSAEDGISFGSISISISFSKPWAALAPSNPESCWALYSKGPRVTNPPLSPRFLVQQWMPWQGRRSHRIIGGHKRRLGARGGAPVGGLGDEVPRSWSFFVKLHIIFALKYNKQQLLSLESTS